MHTIDLLLANYQPMGWADQLDLFATKGTPQ